MRRLGVAALVVCGALVISLHGVRPPTVEAAAPPTVDAAGLVMSTAITFPPSITPVAVRFATDGRIFVADKGGTVLMYQSITDTSPITTLDISSQINTYVDRGLLGIALDPLFTTTRPYLYVLYTYDRDPFGSNTTVPRWNHDCPDPPGGNTDGCTVTARLDRYTINSAGHADVNSKLTLLDGAGTSGGWCDQFPSHSIGTVEFGTDGMLYVGSGDGASYDFLDYGQKGGSPGSPTPANPCDDNQMTGDPSVHSGARGTALSAATSRGGALRVQSVRNALAHEYVSWDGAILRIDPNTGAAAAGNPLIGNGIDGDDRIVAYGLRNPFRFTFRPGTNDLWLGDVGYNTYEEIDTATLGATPASVPNFGWPCYEGLSKRSSSYYTVGNALCTSLYQKKDPTVTLDGGVESPLIAPKYSWSRYGTLGFEAESIPPLPCRTTGGGGAAVGGGFVANANWPSALHGAYVFGDYSRGCLMAMPLDGFGIPDTTKVTSLVSGVAPVDITVGPNGDIYWVDIISGELDFLSPAVGPAASFTATPSAGTLPLHVDFDASATTDPRPADTLTYTWDLTGSGTCDQGTTGVTTTHTYTSPQTVTVKLCVKDQLGYTGSTTRTIQAGIPPVIQSLTTSADANGWKVADVITYAARATDSYDPTLPASAYAWNVVIRHCDAVGGAACHTHPLSTLPAGPSGTIIAPDHEFYAFLQLTLTVTDSHGLSASRTVDLVPRLSSITVQSDPPGIAVAAGGRTGATPYTQQFLEGGDVQLIAPASVSMNGSDYTFAGWTDAPSAAGIRDVRAPATGATITARYVAGRISAVSPRRLLDTRSGLGAPAAPLAAGQPLRLQVTGTSGVDAIAGAVVLNLTAVDARADGYVTAYPCGAVPLVSNLNVVAADTVANLVTVPLDGSGGVCFVAQQPTDLVVDLAAVVSGTGDAYNAIAPTRVVDTREGTGLPMTSLTPGAVAVVPLDAARSAAGAPVDASAVAANITVTNPSAAGFLTAFPCGTVPPTASNVNYSAGQTVSNLALVALGAQHALCITTNVRTDVVIDVSGWLAPIGARVDLVVPQRAIDTRTTSTRLAAGQTLQIDATSLGAPATSTAMIANVTAVDTLVAGFLTVYPCGSRPLASNVNYGARENRPVLAIAALSAARMVCVYSSNPVDLVVDIQGWILGGG